MNFRNFFSTAACLTLLASGAQSADLIVDEVAVAPPPAPAHSWDGFFIGLHGGYGWGNATTSRRTAPPFFGLFAPGYSIESSLDDFLGGVQAGYNVQHNNLVFGIIGDISGTNMSGSGQSPYAALFGVSWETDYNYIATIRGRVGWLWNDTTLFYAHGGLAVADWDTTFTSVGSLNGQSIGGTETGWVVGAGIETAFTDRVSFFAEYSYMDFGGGDESISSTIFPALQWTSNIDPVNVVKVGLNFKLGQP